MTTVNTMTRCIAELESRSSLAQMKAQIDICKSYGADFYMYATNPYEIKALKVPGSVDYMGNAINHAHSLDMMFILVLVPNKWSGGDKKKFRDTPAAHEQFRVDMRYLLTRYPGINGIELEEPGAQSGSHGADLRVWIKHVDDFLSSLDVLVKAAGKNTAIGSDFLWAMNSGSNEIGNRKLNEETGLYSLGINLWPQDSVIVAKKIFNWYQPQSATKTLEGFKSTYTRNQTIWGPRKIIMTPYLSSSGMQKSQECVDAMARNRDGKYDIPECMNPMIFPQIDWANRQGIPQAVFRLQYTTFLLARGWNDRLYEPRLRFIPGETLASQVIKRIWSGGVGQPTSGTLDIRSTPTGAAIKIKGVNSGVTNQKKTLAPGTYKIELTRDGFLPLTDSNVIIEAGKTTLRNYTLVPAQPTTGTLDIRSTPTGAAIKIKGVNSGVTNQKKTLAPGTYKIELTRDGFLPLTDSNVIIEAGKTTLRNYTLVPVQPTTGSLDIRSIPTGAVAYVDGQYKGGTNVLVEGLSPGAHTVKITKNGFNDVNTTEIVKSGTKLIREYILQIATPGTLDIRSIPTGASIKIGAITYGVTNWKKNVYPGTYKIVLTRDGFLPITDPNVIVVAEKTTLKEYTLIQISPTPTTGTLDIRSVPDGAAIKINGGNFGLTNRTKDLPPRTYKVELTRDGFLPITDSNVIIEAGKTTLRNYTLIPVPRQGITTLAGWRSSPYGYQTQSSPKYWINVARAISAKFPGSVPGGIWLVGETDGDPATGTVLYMPASGNYPNIRFEGGDVAEPYLTAFDNAGIKVILQVEPMNADVNTLISIVMNRYKKHPSVIGFGVDNEWYKTCNEGCKATAAEVTAWNNTLHAINPNYVLLIKHFDQSKLPTGIPTDVLVVCDDEQNGSLNTLISEHVAMERQYPANPFGSQIGYPSDKNIWGNMADPVKQIGSAVQTAAGKAISIIWVDFSITTVFPPSQYDR